jgi:hypothetical protein
LKTITRYFTVFFILASASCLYANPYTHFNFTISPGAVTPSVQSSIIITAADDLNNTDTAFSSNVTAAALPGNVDFSETNTNVTGNFTAGIWNGHIRLYGAANPVTVTVTDSSGKSGTVNIPVNAGVFSKVLILVDGLTQDPGTTLTGYSGTPGNFLTGTTFYLTVTACDSYYNVTVPASGQEIVRLYDGSAPYDTFQHGLVVSLTTGAEPTPGKVIVPFIVSSAATVNAKIIAQDYQTDLFMTPVIMFSTNNTYFMWPDINGNTSDSEVSVIAGSPMPVTVKMSNFDRDAGGEGNTIAETIQPGIAAVKVDSLTDYAILETNPIDLSTVSVSMATGAGNTVISAAKVERFQLLPVFGQIKIMGINYDVAKTASNIVQVYAAAPSVFTFTGSNDKIKADGTMTLTVNVKDVFGNPVSGTAVNFSVLPSTGSLSAMTAMTGAYNPSNNANWGTASITYTAPDNAPTMLTITATVAGLGTKQILVGFSGKGESNDKNVITNIPNPFNPSVGPTKISYYLEKDSKMTFKLYNVFGRLVWSKTVNKGEYPNKSLPSSEVYEWNGTTDGGFTVGAGLYILKLKVENDSETYTLERKIAVKK